MLFKTGWISEIIILKKYIYNILYINNKKIFLYLFCNIIQINSIYRLS